MSKQDGYASRTAADLERKYNFGQTFAEVYGLAADARKVADEAQEALEGMDQEYIFNLLTNFGQAQGIYRDDGGDVYINASYIKSGKLAADYIDAENLKVAAANITGELVATQIETKDLKVLAANITGTLTAGQIDTTHLKVSAANITGTLSAVDIEASRITGSVFVAQGDLNADSTSSCFAVEDSTGNPIGYIGYTYEGDDERLGDKLWLKTEAYRLSGNWWYPCIKLQAAGGISAEAENGPVYMKSSDYISLDGGNVYIYDGSGVEWCFKNGNLYKDENQVL